MKNSPPSFRHTCKLLPRSPSGLAYLDEVALDGSDLFGSALKVAGHNDEVAGADKGLVGHLGVGGLAEELIELGEFRLHGCEILIYPFDLPARPTTAVLSPALTRTPVV